MRDISKFKNLANALNMRVRQEYGLVVKLEIHETDEYVAAQYENKEGVALFCIVQTFSTPLDQVIEKIDLFFPHCSFPKLTVLYEFLQYDVLLISEDESGNRVSQKNRFRSSKKMNDFLFDCIMDQIKGE